MKRLFSIIALFSLLPLALQAQEYASPEYVEMGREMSRAKVIAYPSAEEAQLMGGGDVKSQYLQPVAEWTRSEQEDATVFTSQFVVPFSWLSRLALVYVDEASAAYEVLINGKKVGYTANSFSPAEFNITKSAKEDVNSIQIRVLKEHWSNRMNDFSSSTEASVGEVYVFSQPTMRVRDVVHSTRVERYNDKANIDVGIIVKTETLNPKKARIHYELIAPDTTIVTYGHSDLTLGMREEDTVKLTALIPRQTTWSADSPMRYRLNVKTQIEGRYVEYQSHMIGFRDVEYATGDVFKINDLEVTLSYKEFDPRTVTEKDILDAREQGFNAARFKTGAVSNRVYQMCDKLGMYVIAQVPINTSKSGASRQVDGNPSNDPKWRNAYLDRAVTTYYTTRNNACVIGFSLAEQSANGINLYDSYLQMKSLDKNLPVIYVDAEGEWNSD